MATPVDATLVPFGLPKSPFQVEIVARQVGLGSPSEQSVLETRHHSAHVLENRIPLARKFTLKFFVLTSASGARAAGGIQRRVDASNLSHEAVDPSLGFPYQAYPFGDASCQSLEQPFGISPFLTRLFRSKDRWTSARALVMRSPGGCNGPP